jgi:hypothetical protein
LLRKCLPQHFIEGKIEGRIEVTGRWEEEASRCRMTLKWQEDEKFKQAAAGWP